MNFYAAVPSMHVCFAVMIGGSMSRLTRWRPGKILWALYPLLITFVVVATANHYLTDVFLGALTAGACRAAGAAAAGAGQARCVGVSPTRVDRPP